MESLYREAHQDTFRESPGSDTCTLKALKEVYDGKKEIKILDLGCSFGYHTICLARNINGQLIALDKNQACLDHLTKKAQELGLADKIQPVLGDMKDLNFPEASFDIIWSEASLHRIGFANALQEWKKYLKPKGYLVVSDLTWLCHVASEKAEAFWQKTYPSMLTMGEKIDIADNTGYRLVDRFALPHSAWWDNYYTPLKIRLHTLMNKYADDPEKLAFLKKEEDEMEIYRQYGQEYGWVFFVLQKDSL